MTSDADIHGKALAILGVCQRMTSERELNSLLNVISVDAKGLVAADRLSVFLLDETNKELWSAPTHETTSIRIAANTGVAGTAIMTGRSVNVPDAYHDQRFCRNVDQTTGYHTRSLLALPLRNAAGAVIGVFEALNKQSGRFTQEDENILQTFGPQAANAIETAKLIDQLSQRSQVDSDRKAKQASSQAPVILGNNQDLLAVCQLGRRFAQFDVTVLITGDTGTGKELMARHIHDCSTRKKMPFVACNLATIPETLLESELFGYVKGSFTGADKDKPGLLDAADGGTLFLDEIGEIPSNFQVKLLRLLETREYYRVGESSPRTANVRIVAATNKNLDDAISEDQFRKDLYYRVNSAHLTLPALRTRKDDIALLAEHFAQKTCQEIQMPTKKIDGVVEAVLLNYPWPGNIRELKNVIESAVMMSDEDSIQMADLPMHIQEFAATSAATADLDGPRTIDQAECSVLHAALIEAKGDKARAAERLGISIRTLYRKTRKHGLIEGAEDEPV